jgi:predicted metal-dependent hydrolase
MDPEVGGGTGEDPFANGIRLFNEEAFFDAHEHLEGIWREEKGESRAFLQGLIQVCAGFHHLQNGNPAGAAALLRRGADKMRGYPAPYMGIDLATLLAQVDAARARIERMAGGTEKTAPIEFPKIELHPGG